MKQISIPALALAASAAFAQPSFQPIPRSAENQGNALQPVVELPPRYRIEFILFAHNRFNENEEYFDTIPAESQFAAVDEPVAQRFFDSDSASVLRESIEGPISAPALEESEDVDTQGEEPAADDFEILEEFLDPRLVEGPNTRYLDLHELSLLPNLEVIERLDGYTPLVHAGWEQNGLPEEEAIPLDLGEFSSTNPRGSIRLHMSRYLHILVDVAWRNQPLNLASDSIAIYSDFNIGPAVTFPGASQNSSQNPVPPAFEFDPFADFTGLQEPEYYLFEERRILRGELNYFDHPAFGLLLQITLAPEPDTDPEPGIDGPSA